VCRSQRIVATGFRVSSAASSMFNSRGLFIHGLHSRAAVRNYHCSLLVDNESHDLLYSVPMGMTGLSQGRGPGPEDGVTFEARWDLSAHGYADIGQGVMLPEQFIARFIVKDDHTVEMDIATVDGAPLCNAVKVIRHPGRPSLTGHELRRFPLGDWVAFACSMVGVGNQGGVTTTSGEWKTEAYRSDVERVVRRARRRNTVTDDFLRDVARIYRASADSAPVEAVKDAYGPVGHSTAARWVKLARDRGFLPKTSRGKVQAD
jgi:hypothetical protein